MCTACAEAVVCRLCDMHTTHVDCIALCVIVMEMTTLTLNGYYCRDTCDGDGVDDDAYAGDDCACNDAGYVR